MGSVVARAIFAVSLLVKHPFIILNRGRKRAPNLCSINRVIAGLCATFLRPVQLLRSVIVLKPTTTLLGVHTMLVKRKYRQFFSPKNHGKPGSKGQLPELIEAIIELKRRNPSGGLPGDIPRPYEAQFVSG